MPVRLQVGEWVGGGGGGEDVWWWCLDGVSGQDAVCATDRPTDTQKEATSDEHTGATTHTDGPKGLGHCGTPHRAQAHGAGGRGIKWTGPGISLPTPQSRAALRPPHHHHHHHPHHRPPLSSWQCGHILYCAHSKELTPTRRRHAACCTQHNLPASPRLATKEETHSFFNTLASSLPSLPTSLIFPTPMAPGVLLVACTCPRPLVSSASNTARWLPQNVQNGQCLKRFAPLPAASECSTCRGDGGLSLPLLLYTARGRVWSVSVAIEAGLRARKDHNTKPFLALPHSRGCHRVSFVFLLLRACSRLRE